jgi:hypothetical protein
MVVFQFYLQLEKQKSRVGENDSHVVYGRKYPGEKGSVRRCVVVMQQSVPLLPKFRAKYFAYFHAVALKHHSSMWNWLFGLPEWILYEQSHWCQRKWWVCSWPCSSPVLPSLSHWVWAFCVWLMFSSPNACLIITRVSVALFQDFHKIWFCSSVGNIAKLHQARYTTPDERT